MVDLTLLRIRSYRLGNAVAGLYYLGITSLWVLVALYSQQGQGFTALDAGLLGLPSALLAAISSHWAGRRVTEHGRTIVTSGMAIALLGLSTSALVIVLHEMTGLTLWWLLLTLALMGIAQGIVISPNQTLTMREVPVVNAGAAGGLTQTFQRIGTAVGIAVVTAVFYSALPLAGWSVAMTIALSVIAAIVLLALLVSLVDQRGLTSRGEQK